MTQQTAAPRPRHEQAGDATLPRKLLDFSDVATRIGSLYDWLGSRAAEEHAQLTPHHSPPRPRTIPESPLLPVGTRVLIAANGSALDSHSIARFLDGHRKAFRDLVLIHTGAAGAEAIAGKWAEQNQIPQIVYTPDPGGETTARRMARHQSIFDRTPPARIYDFSETGRTSDIANVARERHRPVTVIQNLPGHAQLGPVTHAGSAQSPPSSPIDSLIRGLRQHFTTGPRLLDILPATAEEARALEDHDNRHTLAQLREIRSAEPGYEPPTLKPVPFPEDRPFAEGTRVVVTGSRLPPDREEMLRFLNGLKDAIPDLVLVHGGEPGTEALVDEWARKHDIPQISYPAHPDGETAELRNARYNALLDATQPARFYDLSASDKPSQLAEIARQRHQPVVQQRILMERWAVRPATYIDLNQPGSRVVITGPNSSADPEALSGVLDRLKRSIPDLVLVHSNHPGVEQMTGEWAQANRVPQVVLPQGPAEDLQHEDARVSAMFHKEPVRVYDFTEPGQHSSIAHSARERGLAVTESRSAVERAPVESLGTSSGLSVETADDRDMTPRARISHSF